MMNWRDQQQHFWHWITRPQDLRKSTEQINRLFAPHSHLERAEALGIYNNAFHQRLIQIASDMVPVLYHTLGTEVFTQLWLGYIGAHLPKPGPMSRMVEELPGWVRSHPQFGALPALQDIVRVETLMLELFDRADEPALSVSQLQALPASDWPSMHWQPRQDWALVSSRFDLAGYWQQMQAHIASGAEPGSAQFAVAPVDAADPAQKREYLVQRRQFRMQLRPISHELATFLRLLQQPQAFAAVCEQLGHQFPHEDIPRLSLSLLLQATELELILPAASAGSSCLVGPRR